LADSFGLAIYQGTPANIPVTQPPADVSLEHLLRDLTPQVLGSVVRRFHDFAAAEDAVQEASLATLFGSPDFQTTRAPG
jgi:DNA-directed RNA polymerase specialized sigma24 family protein